MAAEKLVPLTPLPPAPQRFSDDPATFSAKAEASSEALVTMVAEINAGIVSKCNSAIGPMNTVLANLPAIASVSGIVPDVTRVAASVPRVDRVHASIGNVDRVASSADKVDRVHQSIARIDTVHSHISNVDTVSAHIATVDAVAEAEAAVKTTAAHMDHIDIVAGAVADVRAVASDLHKVAAVAADLTQVRTVGEHMAKVSNVAGNMAVVQAVDRNMPLIAAAPDTAVQAAAAAQEAGNRADLARQYAEAASAVAGLPVAVDENDRQVVAWSRDSKRYILVPQGGGGNLVSAPTISLPAQLAIGVASAVRLSSASGLVNTVIVSFQWQENGGPIQDFPATDNAYAGTVTAQGAEGAVWTLRVRAIDDKGNVSAWAAATATLVRAFVNPPTLTAPVAGTMVSNQTVTLTATPFAASHLTDTHKASRWLITSDEAGEIPLHDSGWLTTSLTSYTAVLNPVAGASADLFAHVLYEGDRLGPSARSAPVALKTSSVVRPTVTLPVAGGLVGTGSLALACAEFATAGGQFDTHAATRWRVTTDAAGNSALFDSGWSTEHLTACTATLSPLAAPSSELFVWVEQRGVLLGDSAKSASVRVMTGAVMTPDVVSPAAEGLVLPTGFPVTGSAFTSTTGLTDTLQALYAQVATDSGFANTIYDSGRVLTGSPTLETAFPPQTQGTALWVRLRYEGATLGVSDWSAAHPVRVSTLVVPSITSPTTGASVNRASIPLSSSAFAANGVTDTHVASYWKLCADAAGTSVLWQSGRDTAHLTSCTVTSAASALEPGNTVYAFVRHEGAGLGTSAWSAGVPLAVAAVIAPAVTSPIEGTADASIRPIVQLAPWADSGGLDTGSTTRVQISTVETFASVVWDSEEIAYTTSVQVTTDLEFGAVYYVRGYHTGTWLGATPWGTPTLFRTATGNTMTILGGAGADYINALCLIPDGRVVFAGKSDSAGTAGGLDHLLGVASISANTMTINALKRFGGTSAEEIRALATLPDGRIVFGGCALNTATSAWAAQLGLATISQNSITINDVKQFGGDKSDMVSALSVLPGGRVVFGGSSKSTGSAGYEDCLLGVASISGNTLTIDAMRRFGGNDTDSIAALSTLPDGRVVFGGTSYSSGTAGMADCLLGVASISGNTLTVNALKRFGGNSLEALNALTILGDGRVVFCGDSLSTGSAGELDCLLGVVSISGNTLTLGNVKRFGGNGADSLRGLSLLPDGRVAFGGASASTGALGGKDFVLGAASISGSTIALDAVKRLGGDNVEDAYALSTLADGRMVFGGCSGSTGSIGGQDCLLGVVTAAPCEVTLPAPAGWKCQMWDATVSDWTPTVSDWSPTNAVWSPTVTSKTLTVTDWKPSVTLYPF